MLAQEDSAPQLGSVMPLQVAADLQHHLMVASNDLERLQRLLSEACDSLLGHFCGASSELRSLAESPEFRTLPGDGALAPEPGTPTLRKAMAHRSGAITVMQFQDMGSQLVAHTTRRLRSCADRLASEAMGEDEAEDEDGVAVVEALPLRPNRVTHDEMYAGSVELF